MVENKNVLKGKCRWFDIKKGFGFIRADKDYFAHFSKIIGVEGEFKVLEAGEEVEFVPHVADRGEGTTKPQAIKIKKLKKDDEHEVFRND